MSKKLTPDFLREAALRKKLSLEFFTEIKSLGQETLQNPSPQQEPPSNGEHTSGSRNAGALNKGGYSQHELTSLSRFCF